MATKELTIFDLPCEDIICDRILHQFELEDLFRLRRVSKQFKIIVESYWGRMLTLDLSIESKFNLNAFMPLSEHCRNIKILDVSSCEWLSDEILKIFFKNNKRLLAVILSKATTIGPKSLQCLIVNCKDLLLLDLSHCNWLTSGAVDGITYHQKRLKWVNFYKCTQLDQATIVKFVSGFRGLKFLSLGKIPSVTDDVLVSISIHCPEIETLDVTGCAVSPKGTQYVKNTCNKLCYLKTEKGRLFPNFITQRLR